MELILNLDWLKVVYIVGALGAVAMAIIFYPTFKYGSKDDDKQKKLNGKKSVKSR